MLHRTFRHSNKAIGKKDLALCLASTYFAVQSAFQWNVKGDPDSYRESKREYFSRLTSHV